MEGGSMRGGARGSRSQMRRRWKLAGGTGGALLALMALVGAGCGGGSDEQWFYPPTSHPDRIILTWESDPATTQSVSWRTDTSVDQALALLAHDGASPDFREEAARCRPRR